MLWGWMRTQIVRETGCVQFQLLRWGRTQLTTLPSRWLQSISNWCLSDSGCDMLRCDMCIMLWHVVTCYVILLRCDIDVLAPVIKYATETSLGLQCSSHVSISTLSKCLNMLCWSQLCVASACEAFLKSSQIVVASYALRPDHLANCCQRISKNIKEDKISMWLGNSW